MIELDFKIFELLYVGCVLGGAGDSALISDEYYKEYADKFQKWLFSVKKYSDWKRTDGDNVIYFTRDQETIRFCNCKKELPSWITLKIYTLL